MKILTCKAPVNIAVIKYWGKRNDDLILPLNDSLSSTLSIEHLATKTTVLASPSLTENKFWLNGEDIGFENGRLKTCLRELKLRASPHVGDLAKWNISICSENNFPTAAGLASSAAGYACLVYTLAKLYEVEGDISVIARKGSGSACRSVRGGWVKWNKGSLEDGSDSKAEQIVCANHWPEIRILILVVNDQKKAWSSTSGMKRSVETSELLKFRTQNVVPKRMERIIGAIKNRDFNTFAEITMRDSNQFHAICLDTDPPCMYMNDTSRDIISLVHAYNDFYKKNKVAYTFDAGPNACLYLLNDDIEDFLYVINSVFSPPTNNSDGYFRGLMVQPKVNEELKTTLKLTPQLPGTLKYIICTKVGVGPQIITESSEHLLSSSGLPK